MSTIVTGGGTTSLDALASTTIYLAAGSVVRAHTDGAASNNTSMEQFQITRVA